MPTGYTQILENRNDVTLTEFALRCATRFSHLISMKDRPLGTPVPEYIEVDPKYAIDVELAKDELRAAKTLTFEQVVEALESERLSEVERLQRCIVRDTEFNRRAAHMLVKVQSWNPIHKDQVALKQFMVEQLVTSFDGTHHLLQKLAEVKNKPVYSVRHHCDYVARATNSLKTAEDKLLREQEQAADATAFLRELRASLAKAEQAMVERAGNEHMATS